MKRAIGVLLVCFALGYGEVYLGSEKGLFVVRNQDFVPVWTNGRVWEVLPFSNSVVLRTSQGVFLYIPSSGEMISRSVGLKTWTIQDVGDGEAIYTTEYEPLMDLAIARDNPSVWAACSKSTVYLSTNAGESWMSLGSPTYRGWTSVAVEASPRLTVWAGHALNGIFCYDGRWRRESRGLFADILYHEEVSSLVVVPEGTWKGVWAVNNFFPHLYRYASTGWEKRTRLAEDEGFASSLVVSGEGMLVTTERGVMLYDGTTLRPWQKHHELALLCESFARQTHSVAHAALFHGVALSDLWVWQSPILSPRQQKAAGKIALYLPPSVVAKPARFQSLVSLGEQRGINAVVIDLKDDWGNLRFAPREPLLKSLGHARPLPLSLIIEEARKRGWYVIGRIVLFQDRVLSSVSNAFLAAWDRDRQKPWQGIKTVHGEQKDIQEYWVDTYHPLVWQYNLAIAREAVSLGCDEIQFDYVRFPTDGENLSSLSYRARGASMTPESLLYSFLRYMRRNLDVPISMDIYGANGWYRTSLRTYQEIDLLSPFIDVFCPMYYPSHFDQGFMGYDPPEDRPYRIYFYGSKRNRWITKNTSLIRPYVQAFKIGVSYDRKYYGPAYVQKEILGVWSGEGSGFTLWNMGGEYRILTNLTLTGPLTSPAP